MEKDLLNTPPEFKLYKDRAVYVGTLLGGPLVAGYLIAENFKELGEKEKAMKSRLLAVVVSVVVIGGAFVIPSIERFPRMVIPIVYSVMAQFMVQRFQGESIKTHLESGGQVFSIRRTVAIGMLGLAITVGIIFLILLLTGTTSFL